MQIEQCVFASRCGNHSNGLRRCLRCGETASVCNACSVRPCHRCGASFAPPPPPQSFVQPPSPLTFGASDAPPRPLVAQRGEPQTHAPSVPLCVGIATWNVAHFGQDPIALLSALMDVREKGLEVRDLYSSISRKNLARNFLECLRLYSTWEARVVAALTRLRPVWEQRVPPPHGALLGHLEKLTALSSEQAGGTKTGRAEPGTDDEDEEAEEEAGEENGEDEAEVEQELKAEFSSEFQHIASGWAAYERAQKPTSDQSGELVGIWSELLERLATLHLEEWQRWEAVWKDFLDNELRDAAEASVPERDRAEVTHGKRKEHTREAAIDKAIQEREAAVWSAYVANAEAPMRAFFLTVHGPCMAATHQLRKTARMLVRPAEQLRERMKHATKLQKELMVLLSAAGDSEAGTAAAIKEAFDAMKKAMRSWPIATVKSVVERLEQMLHKILVIHHIQGMFQNNPWLEVLLLHEVNRGIDLLKTELATSGLACIAGPHLKSKGKGNRGQHEFYPIVIRAGGTISVEQVFWHGLNGLTGTCGPDESPLVEWNKSTGTYRPVVGYQLVHTRPGLAPVRFRVGIVHTSPGGSEFERPFVYSQLETVLPALADSAPSAPPLIIGGDFYLTAEATTTGWSGLDRSQRETANAEVEEQRRRIDVQIDALSRSPQSEEVGIQLARLQKIRESLGSDRVQVARNPLGITVTASLTKAGFATHQPITGTNWKTRGIHTWYAAQIADFFISDLKEIQAPYSTQTQRVPKCTVACVGLMSPVGGIWMADSEDLVLARYWRASSDHFPIGGIFSTTDRHQEINQALHAMQEVASNPTLGPIARVEEGRVVLRDGVVLGAEEIAQIERIVFRDLL